MHVLLYCATLGLSKQRRRIFNPVCSTTRFPIVPTCQGRALREPPLGPALAPPLSTRLFRLTSSSSPCSRIAEPHTGSRCIHVRSRSLVNESSKRPQQEEFLCAQSQEHSHPSSCVCQFRCITNIRFERCFPGPRRFLHQWALPKATPSKVDLLSKRRF